MVAFLFRHDHGLFIGAAALVGIALVPGESIRARLRAARVYVTLVRLPAHEEIARRFPLIENHLGGRFAPLADAPLPDGDSIRLLVNRSLRPTRVDAQTRWPCYR